MQPDQVYSELCATYRALDDFRARLLALLPFASGAGIIVALAQQATPGFAIVAALGALVTVGLFVHECRTIVRCQALKDAGKDFEARLGKADVGMFSRHPDGRGTDTLYPLISTGVASAIVYGVVFGGWVIAALWLALDPSAAADASSSAS